LKKLRTDYIQAVLNDYVVQNFSSSQLPSKNVSIKIYKTMFLPVVLYECEAVSHFKGRRGCVREYLDLRRIRDGKMEKIT
jgi:hypothetical protein